MSEPGNWQASLLEQRMAWGIAAICIMLVMLASARPEWFDFTTPHPTPVAKQTQSTSTKHAATRQRQTHPTRAKPPATAAKKAPVIHAKAKTSPLAKPTAITGGFYVQVGAFKEHLRARGLADQLKRQGSSVVIVSKKDGLHAVWIGPKKTRAEAEKLLKTMHLKHNNKGFIIHQKQV